MAEDKVASLSTEVSESEKKLREEMQELKRKLIIDEIFVRTRSPCKFILGPCYKNVISTELSPHYPLAEGEKLLLHSAEPDWSKDKTTMRSWPKVSGTWIDWVDRVEKAKWEVWKSADIYDTIQLSKHDIPMDKNLLYAALCYWSISTNSFHFRFGMMGPTVLDIVALTGLRPHGEDVSFPLGMAKLARDFPEYGKIKECLTYCKFLDVSMGAVPVTEDEHISFLVMWLCRYLFCNSSMTMIEQCTKLALALAKGKKVALAPFVLSNLYHSCTDIVTGEFDDARGPFWILQLWLQAYFPEHQLLTSDDGNPPTYGHALADGVLRPKTFNQYFLFFNKCSSRTASQFTPFSSRKFGPEWFKRSLDPYFQKLNRTELRDIWASYLIARDIPYSILLDESSKCIYGVEHYSPNQFARQFGMTQAIPFNQSANDLSVRRENFQSVDDIEETETRFYQLKRKFSFVPFNVNPSSNEFFDFWWSTYMKNRDKTTTATDVLRKISLYVSPLNPPERHEIAAHRSNGIKGNSQSEGKFGRNLKRKCKGYSIPSRSFAQQDNESRQQRNSYEAAETRSTICKKMKTSAMEMPLPGTTFTVPFTSAFPCTPADEDRSKAEDQVSADDRSVSASSSTSFSTSEKEGEQCIVSPSLAETGSKASDVSEPLDCPVKFDNLEEFFARVSGQIRRAQSLGFSADRSSPVDEKISTTHNTLPSAEMLATAKDDIERLLIMPSKDLLLSESCSKLNAALSIYTASRDLSVERALAFEKLKANLPQLSSTYHRAKKDKDDYYKMAAKKVILVDELTKGQEHYANLKDYSDKLECTTDSIRNQIIKLKASLKDAETKRKAIQDQKLSLAKKCFEKSNALDEMEAEFHVMERMKELADSDIARVDESLTDLKSKIIESRV